ncbi:MAG: hypothetical protein QM811_25040 [Pirellulales bacterium]
MTTAELTTTIERLIDDELTVAEERALLTYLEANPEHWRTCALAFVEHRASRTRAEAGCCNRRPTPRVRRWPRRSRRR